MLAYYFRAPKPAARLVWPSISGGRLVWQARTANQLDCSLFPHPRIRYDRLLIPLEGQSVLVGGKLRIAIYDPTDGAQIHYEEISHTLVNGAHEMHETILPQGVVERPPGQLAILAKTDGKVAHLASDGHSTSEWLGEFTSDFDWSAVTLQVAVGSGGNESVGWVSGRRVDGDMTMPATLPDWSGFTELRSSQWMVYFVDGPAWETVRDLT